MDLPIVIRSPVTAADRLRWLLLTVCGGLACYGFGRAAPWILERLPDLMPAIDPAWTLAGVLLIWWLPGLLAFVMALRLLFEIDHTWTMDEDTLTVRSVFVVGRRTRTWRLCSVTGVRLHTISGGDGNSYKVQIYVDGHGWTSIRVHENKGEARAFKQRIEDVLSAVQANGRCE